MDQKRAEYIQNMIDSRKEKGETRSCIFYITVPKNTNIRKDPVIQKVEEMLDRNHVTHGHVDTVEGTWNLNRDWVQTDPMDCIVEYCGVYPTGWEINDVEELERMENDGEILVMVDWIVGGEYIPNH